jgi:[ribosomal protein S5]-alanine N-acetyltransferase
MGHIDFHPFPVLATSRLILKKLVRSDARGIFALRSNEDVIKYTGIPQYASIDEAHAYISHINQDLARSECIMWSIRLKSNDQFIGSICIWNIALDGACAEIGYDLLPQYQGQGFMQEAVRVVIDYGFEGMQLGSIVAYLRTENTRSVRLLERNGFVKGKVHDLMADNGTAVEMVAYTLDRNGYKQAR